MNLASFRDREKDRSYPNYNRNYGRYARGIPPSSLNLMPFNFQQVQHPFMQYDIAFNQLSQMSPNQAFIRIGSNMVSKKVKYP